MKISPEQKRLAQRLFRRLTLGKIVLLFAVIWVTPTLLPHLGALVGRLSGIAMAAGALRLLRETG
ncbi:MAG: hypothetical protein EBY77_08490 [Rhodobacteraceae bacterium]|nr:hypothetical protein [Paracoccaceae bacterium]